MEAQNIPRPTYSATLAFAHLVRSPPFPQPMSSTRPRMRPPPRGPGEAESAGWAKRVMRTLLTQLLKLFRPMMGESCLCATPTSGRALSIGIKSRSVRAGGNDVNEKG